MWVYVLGDVAINRRFLPLVEKLNGKKILIKGNHDVFKIGEYLKYFHDVRGSHLLDGMILSHIPIHPDSLARFGKNVHGHLHSNRVMLNDEIDPRYFCVSVEHINFRPMPLEVLRSEFAKQNIR